jgi:FixJ family two-component response regulator
VLLDLSLPDGRGIDVVRKIVEASGKVAVIVLTGWAGAEVAAPAKAAGADDVMLKPADPKEINKTLQWFVIQRRHDEEAHAIEKLLAEMSKPIMRVREIAEQKAEKIKEVM